ncbi:galacturonosyltransferase 12 [Striga asiatica]|uniref:Hexosyltransferase n=1 Tax=Striga asiatica TaxID=4170 RepID=A0A5A7R7B2_STRAF|nr:galacturonosyltransferase 12 [Striga asiatica]
MIKADSTNSYTHAFPKLVICWPLARKFRNEDRRENPNPKQKKETKVIVKSALEAAFAKYSNRIGLKRRVTVLEKPYVIAAKLQALSPKYNSLMNHIRINLPELFPSLNKVVFLDDDIVVQTDLSPLWDIHMNGKVNGAVEIGRGGDKYVMSKRFKSYLNFSHPLIANNFDLAECAWAYSMNVFDLEARRRTNISRTYHF